MADYMGIGKPFIIKALTKQQVSDKPSLNGVIKLTDGERHELISMLKTMEGFKRKIQLLLK